MVVQTREFGKCDCVQSVTEVLRSYGELSTSWRDGFSVHGCGEGNVMSRTKNGGVQPLL
jgi:hypothetical protein